MLFRHGTSDYWSASCLSSPHLPRLICNSKEHACEIAWILTYIIISMSPFPLLLAANFAYPDSRIYVFTKAPPTDIERANDVIKILTEKRIRVEFLLTGDWACEGERNGRHGGTRIELSSRMLIRGEPETRRTRKHLQCTYSHIPDWMLAFKNLIIWWWWWLA